MICVDDSDAAADDDDDDDEDGDGDDDDFLCLFSCEDLHLVGSLMISLSIHPSADLTWIQADVTATTAGVFFYMINKS